MLERTRSRSLIDQMNAAHTDLLAGIPATQAQALRTAQTNAEIQLASLEKQWEGLDSKSGQEPAELEVQQKRLAQSLVAAREQVAQAKTAIQAVSPAYRNSSRGL